jgi:hypothetical protein
MIQDLGFDATYLTLFGDSEWKLLEHVAVWEQAYGLPVEAVYAMAAPDDIEMWQRICQELLPALPTGTALELALPLPNDASLAPATVCGYVLEGLRNVLAAAGDTEVRLYPHLGFWLATSAAAMDLCKAIDDPRLSVNFCGFHWFAGDPQSLREVLELIRPALGGVNLAGSRTGGALYGYTIEALDQGMLDHFMELAELHRVGYQGRLGLQGYANGGDVYDQLRRSRAALQSLQQRLHDHPEWANFTFEPTEHLASFRAQAATQS